MRLADSPGMSWPVREQEHGPRHLPGSEYEFGAGKHTVTIVALPESGQVLTAPAHRPAASTNFDPGSPVSSKLHVCSGTRRRARGRSARGLADQLGSRTRRRCQHARFGSQTRQRDLKRVLCGLEGRRTGF
jgi:hypothetical protein